MSSGLPERKMLAGEWVTVILDRFPRQQEESSATARTSLEVFAVYFSVGRLQLYWPDVMVVHPSLSLYPLFSGSKKKSDCWVRRFREELTHSMCQSSVGYIPCLLIVLRVLRVDFFLGDGASGRKQRESFSQWVAKKNGMGTNRRRES